jgi:serine/threonine protein kinase
VACATARISHPSIVRIFDVDTSEREGHFLVMELLHGPTLSDTLAARGRFTPEEAALLVLPIAGAAAAAHAEGVVHRDIKPQNVMLVDGGDGAVVPKLIDFGVAHLMAEPESTRITRTGMMVGSPAYMAPEQVRAHGDIDARADVWALCALFYELVAGITPFRRETPYATLEAILAEEVSCPGALRGEPELWSILRRGLAKERSQRWTSARELGRELAAWALGRGIDADAAGTSLASCWFGKRHASLFPEPRPVETLAARAA